MNAEMMGIYVSIAVLVGVLGVAGMLSGEFDLGLTGETKIPQITAGTSTSTPNSYYAWCYNMKLDCG